MHPNARLARDAYDLFTRRDIPALLDLCADMTLSVSGRSVQSGTFVGREGMARYFTIVREHTGGTHRVEVLDVLANDTGAVALLRALGERGDDVFDMTVIHVFRIADGRLREMAIVPYDQYGFDAFWS